MKEVKTFKFHNYNNLKRLLCSKTNVLTQFAMIYKYFYKLLKIKFSPEGLYTLIFGIRLIKTFLVGGQINTKNSFARLGKKFCGLHKFKRKNYKYFKKFKSKIVMK